MKNLISNNKKIFSFIYKLINPKLENNFYEFFPADEFFWEKVVNIGSHQLVLPAIYQGIMDKKSKKYSDKIDKLS